MKSRGVLRGSRFALLACLTAVPLSVLAFACGAGESGTVPDTNPPDTGPGDAGTDAPLQPICVTGDAHACDGLPTGWHAVRYIDDGGACDPGFQAESVLTDPDGGSCECNTTCTPDAGQCSTDLQNIAWDFSIINSTCESPRYALQSPQPCNRFQDFVGYVAFTTDFKASPRSIGNTVSCSYDAVPADGSASARTASLCSGSSGACSGVLCADPHVCIAADNDGTDDCPSHYHQVQEIGSGLSMQCGAGSCGCSGKCDVGTTFLYTDDKCGTTGVPVKADGVCHILSDSEVAYQSIQYVPSVSPQGCNAPPRGTAKLTGRRWVCCHD